MPKEICQRCGQELERRNPVLVNTSDSTTVAYICDKCLEFYSECRTCRHFVEKPCKEGLGGCDDWKQGVYLDL